MENSQIGSWLANHVRVSFFSGQTWAQSPSAIFTALVGEEPTATQRMPSGEHAARGLWNGASLTVQQIINRVDLILQPDESLPSPGRPPLIQFELLRDLMQSVVSWAERQEVPIHRIALGGQALLPQESLLSGYEFLKDSVRMVKLDPDRVRDFNIQLNLREPSSVVPDLILNRLTTWGCVEMKSGMFQFSAGTLAGPIASMLQSHFFGSCTVDINTAPEWGHAFTPEQLKPLCDELQSHAFGLLIGGVE